MSMATRKLREEQEEIIDRGLVCSICTEIFTNPRSLECGHNFCSECLEADVKARSRGGKYPCPICRRSISVPRGGAKQFFSNILVKNLAESMNRVSDGEQCSVCDECLASSVCLTCDNVVMCISCKKQHRIGRARHRIVRSEEVSKIFEQRLLNELSKATSKMRSRLDLDEERSANFEQRIGALKNEVQELVNIGVTSVVLTTAKKLDDLTKRLESDLEYTVGPTVKIDESASGARANVETDLDNTLIGKAVYLGFSETNDAFNESLYAVGLIILGLMLHHLNPFCYPDAPVDTITLFTCDRDMKVVKRNSETIEAFYFAVSGNLMVCIGVFFLIRRIARAYEYFLPFMIAGHMYSFMSVLGRKKEQILSLYCSSCEGFHCAILTTLSRHHIGQYCNKCKKTHSMNDGDMRLTADMFGIRLTFLACIDQKIYNVNEHVACQSKSKFNYFDAMQQNVPPGRNCDLLPGFVLPQKKRTRRKRKD